ncbi:class I histocompatibility antigen, F10 alpha chain-like isoform X2 [Pogoniulus pusillus]|uniref:class I histocompatibility antigen, F10 alpha chain-like isoform X2 n=1 Tax=Pogoniulus pusillus TaxID=488313 RepID=UPI0030B97912
MGSGRAPSLGLLLALLSGVATGLHSLRYFDVLVAEPSPGVPQFVGVGYVDGVPIVRYDSERGDTVAPAAWMVANVERQYWERNTQVARHNQQLYRLQLRAARARYNQSGRGETWQSMVGCDLLDDGSTRGYFQTAYDGRDFLAFDMGTMTFTAADEVALVTKRSWEEDGTVAERWKHYLQDTCIEWLKKYLSYGREVLERKEPPTVRVSGKETQGTLTLSCRVYGFYPRPIAVSWLKGAEVRDQDTQRGGIVPNSDGTFSTWASIEVLPQERDKYRCQVDHSSLSQPGLFAWGQQQKGYTSASGSDGGSSSSALEVSA